MKKVLVLMLLLTLALSGCGQKPPVEETKAPAEEAKPPVETNASAEKPAIQREEKTNLQVTVEGKTEEVPASLYIGNGYSIYIPEEGWRLDEWENDDGVQETVWESTVNDDVELYVLRYPAYPDASVNTTKSRFAQGSGHVFEDLMGGELGDPLTGVDEDGDGDYLGFMVAEGLEGVTYVVAWEYPANAAEGFGVRLPQIANTFEVTK